jgi:uncharacterized protein (TIGR03790 family)
MSGLLDGRFNNRSHQPCVAPAVYPCGKAESIAGGEQTDGRTFGKTGECALENAAPGRQTGRTLNAARHLLLRAAFGLLPLLLVAGVRADDLAARVILLANSDDPDSLHVARHYAEMRGVPLENIIAQKMPLTEAITWREFVATVWQPLQDELVRRQWIDGIAMALTDSLGRKKYAMNRHRIAALVVCRGVPLKIAHAPEFYAESPPFTVRSEFRTNAGAVDSELSLLALGGYNINAFVPNPLFQNASPSEFERAQVVKVARLDGPTVEDALALVDRALAAERTGLVGRAYVDLGGIHPDGDRWLELVATQLAALGFEPQIDHEPATMPATARCDAPVLYFGWYAGDLNGPFALPGFQFPPGAIALHIHSYSASSLRSATQGWCGPLIARGATATVGNVYEPYLQLTHRPDLLLRALARGANLVDAAYYSLAELSWQAVLIGDPLYRPFAVSFEEQWRNRAALPPRLAGYAVLRRMSLLEAAGKDDEAGAVARTSLRELPSLAVGVALAQRREAAGDAAGAASALGFAPRLTGFQPDEWVLAHDAAQLLAANGRPAQAVEVYRELFTAQLMPRELRAPWLRAAGKIALAAQNPAQAAAWEQELDELIAQVPGTKK